MKKRVAARAVAFWLAWALLLAVVLAGCTAEDAFQNGPGGGGGDGTPGPALSDPDFERTPPPVQLAEYAGAAVETRAEGDRSAEIDVTNAAKGYFGAKCTTPVQARVRLTKGAAADGGERIDYLIEGNGSPQYYPFSMGSGTYTISLWFQVEGSQYEQFLLTTVEVGLESEFAPFLVPNKIVDYDAGSQCVELSHEITRHCKTDLEVLQQIYAWIADNVDYDEAKAQQLQGNSGTVYIPSPDDTLRTKSGICYDYASLAAAMLRANGLPTKLVKGDVLGPEGAPLYHAWNLVWIDEAGWVAVQLPTKPGEWTRIDTTYAAAGSGMGSFIGDGENYTDLTYH